MEETGGSEESPPTSGRRLRGRASNVTPSEESGKGRRRSKQTKRKAEVDVESLYLQVNSKEPAHTPLETIYEAPQNKRGRRKLSTDEATNSPGSNETVMGARKVKRLCMFVSHYYPSKQKTKQRKDRARKMRQQRGIKLPKGNGVSIDDVQAALACVSDSEGEQNENLPNASILSNLSHNSTCGFYSGNIIRPDTSEVHLQGMIEDLKALQVDLPSHIFGEEGGDSRATNDTLPSLAELDEPLPFTDPVTDTRRSQSRDKKSRRRSGRVANCFFSGLSRTQELEEEEVVPPPRNKDNISPEVPSTRELEGIAETQNDFSDLPYTITGAGEAEREEVAATDDSQKRKPAARKGRATKKVKTSLLPKRPCEDKEEVIAKKREKAAGRSDTTAPCDVSDEQEQTAPWGTAATKNKPADAYENTPPTVTVTAPKSKRMRGRGRAPMRSQGKRRDSGIQRPMYHSLLIASPDVSSDGASLSTSNLESSVEGPGSGAEGPGSGVEGPGSGNLASSEMVSRAESRDMTNPAGADIAPNRTEGQELVQSASPDVVLRFASPNSPTTQLAALTLHPELPSDEPAAQQTARGKRTARRKSSRLSISSIRADMKENSSDMGSYWSSSPYRELKDKRKSLSKSLFNSQEVSEKLHTLVEPQDIADSNAIGESDDLNIVKSVNDSYLGCGKSNLEPSSNPPTTPKVALQGQDIVLEDCGTPKVTLQGQDIVLEDCSTPKVALQGQDIVLDKDCSSYRTPNAKNIKEGGSIWQVFDTSQSQKKSNKLSPKETKEENNISVGPARTPLNTVIEDMKVVLHKTPEIVNANKTEMRNPPDVNTRKAELLKTPDNTNTASEARQIFTGIISDYDSPIISGMFAGKAGIRLGKVYRNKEASPVELPLLCIPQKQLLPAVQEEQEMSDNDGHKVSQDGSSPKRPSQECS